ncbi:MAG: YkvA family protein [Clostridium sp.]
MRISKVAVELSGSDILSIINEFVKIDGLELKNVTVDKAIYVEGTYKMGLAINFAGELEILGVNEGKVVTRFSSCKVMKVGFFRMIRSYALKTALAQLEVKGITSEKDNIIIDVNKILSDIPFVDIKMKDTYIKGQALHVDVEDINISIAGELIKTQQEDVLEGEVLEEEQNITLPSEKIVDNYTVGRKYVENKLPNEIKKYSDYILAVPDIVALLYRLLKDKRVKMSTKLIISASVGYVVFPTDIIPNNIPFIGRIDDIAVVFFALNRIVNDVPLQIILENYAGKDELLLLLTNGLDYIVNFTGAKNVEKLYSVIEEIKTL